MGGGQEGGEGGSGGGTPLRILVLGGPYEAHHNQLCFYNYFERVRDQGILTWSSGLYASLPPDELDRYDLVIFSRPRYPEATPLLDRCRSRGIRTLVMIDDNWIAAGRELPRYASLFSPGRPDFETFLDALRRATATLVYNEVLEEDVRPHARRVLRLEANVELDLFPLAPEPSAPPRGDTFLAGYAGSPRFEDSAFRALAAFATAAGTAGGHQNVRLFVMAHELPEALAGLPRERIDLHPFTDYLTYARTVTAARPDVLLAPLDATRFSASKCPNKYLETAAAGAAGIYSRLPPYTAYVRDGETGLLVDNDEAAWRAALERLHRDRTLCRTLGDNARRDVDERYSTRARLPAFLAMLQEVMSLPVAGRTRTPRAARAKILYINHLAALSGADQALLRLLSHLDRTRFEPVVVLPEDGPLKERLEALAVRTRILPIHWWIPATHWSEACFRAQLQGLPERVEALARLAEEEEADLIHTNTVVTLEGALAAARLGLPHIWHSRGLVGEGFPPPYFGDLPFLFQTIDRLADAIVCVSKGVEEQTAEFLQGKSTSSRPIIADGFDAAAFLARPVGSRADLLRRHGLADPVRLIATLGGIQRRKGQLDLIEAVALLQPDFPDLALILAGEATDAEYLATLDTRIAELGLQNTVHRIGFEPDVRTLLAHAELLVHPSHSEGFSLAILEAMAAGKPVIATRSGGPEELLEDGVSGILVPVQDPQSLAVALRSLLEDRETAAFLGKAAAERALLFGLDKTARQTEAVYETLLAGRGEGTARHTAAERILAEVEKSAGR
jgi:glycosyltransferase involved in cell wall biosynthesis